MQAITLSQLWFVISHIAEGVHQNKAIWCHAIIHLQHSKKQTQKIQNLQSLKLKLHHLCASHPTENFQSHTITRIFPKK